MMTFTPPDFTGKTPDEIVCSVSMALDAATQEHDGASLPPIHALALFMAAALAIATTLREEARATLAALGDLTTEAKPARAPRKARAEKVATTPEQLEAHVLKSLALKSPQTLAEVATMAGVTRTQGQIAIGALLTSGDVTRERAGKGWRYHVAGGS